MAGREDKKAAEVWDDCRGSVGCPRGPVRVEKIAKVQASGRLRQAKTDCPFSACACVLSLWGSWVYCAIFLSIFPLVPVPAKVLVGVRRSLYMSVDPKKVLLPIYSALYLSNKGVSRKNCVHVIALWFCVDVEASVVLSKREKNSTCPIPVAKRKTETKKKTGRGVG